jgi:hypothetical protein
VAEMLNRSAAAAVEAKDSMALTAMADLRTRLSMQTSMKEKMGKLSALQSVIGKRFFGHAIFNRCLSNRLIVTTADSAA